MTRYVALLRGVNVGGVRLLMADLRAAAEGLGHTDVATYVQSGNLTFTASGDACRLADALCGAIREAAGIQPVVTVLSSREWDQVVTSNPYPEEVDGTKLHAVVHHRDYTPEEIGVAERIRDTERAAGSDDDLTVIGRAIYLHLPNGMGRSKLAEKLGRSKAAGQHEATARNWRTVLALQERLRG